MRKYRHRRHQFLAAWIRSPLKMGALVPSSRGLASAMARQVNLKKTGMIIELGAGTGIVTHALLQAGVPPERLLVLEREPKLHSILQAHFPGLKVLCADAVELTSIVKQEGISEVNAIVSSLPLMSMPKKIRKAIVEQMALLMKPAFGGHAHIVQFTYAPGSPINPRLQHRHHIHGHRVKFVIANVPPAHVWVYDRLPFPGECRGLDDGRR